MISQEKFETIITSSINGQWKQAFNQFNQLDEWDKLDFIKDLDLNDEHHQNFAKYLLKKLID